MKREHQAPSDGRPNDDETTWLKRETEVEHDGGRYPIKRTVPSDGTALEARTKYDESLEDQRSQRAERQKAKRRSVGEPNVQMLRHKNR